jgi:hypothetical protein
MPELALAPQKKRLQLQQKEGGGGGDNEAFLTVRP